MMRKAALPTVALMLTVGAQAADVGGGWRGEGDAWGWSRDIRQALLHRAGGEADTAVNRDLRGTHGAWRCTVEPGFGGGGCGMGFLASPQGEGGLRCEIAGYEGGGFALRDALGEVLWADEWAPILPYCAYTLEAVADSGRVRAQMLDGAGVLLSQGPWVDVDAALTDRPGHLSAHAEGAARFWGWELAEEPLSPITDDAPNKRRLAQGPESDWAIHGRGNWMWTDGTRQRVRQYSNIERTWALSKKIGGADRVWQSWVRVSPGAGGAGLVVKSTGEPEEGFLIWLGGKYGAGCLLAYRYPLTTLWGGKQDLWHYDEDLLLRAETKDGKLSAQLIASDGETVLSESPWLDMTPEESEREGTLGFHTWKGSAEFWGFSTGTAAASSETPVAADADLSGVFGEGATVRLRPEITGTRGVWRCMVSVPEGTRGAGLLFQIEDSLEAGFIAYLSEGNIQLIDLSRPEEPRFEADVAWQRDREYTLEGIVTTDRVALKLLDGDTVLVESPDVYISDTNNDREGVIGTLSVDGEASFSGVTYEAE